MKLKTYYRLKRPHDNDNNCFNCFYNFISFLNIKTYSTITGLNAGFFCFQELPKVKSNNFLTPRNFYIFIRVIKKAGEDTTKNYTDPTAPAAQNNFRNENNIFKNQYKNYQTI